MEGSHEAERQADIKESESRFTASSHRRVDQCVQVNDDKEVVRLAVSHAKLAEVLESVPGLELDMANEGKRASQRLTKH